MNQQTRTGLAPKSWGAVVVWLVIIAVVISRPADSIALAFATVRGTGQWLAYTAFADCDEPPPMGWMSPKECPAPPPPEGATTNPTDPPPPTVVPPAAATGPDDGQAAPAVDGSHIRRALDAGTERVEALHAWAVDAQQNRTSVFALGTDPNNESSQP